MNPRRITGMAMLIALLFSAAVAFAESSDLSYRPYREPYRGDMWRGGSMQGRTMARVHVGVSFPTGDFGDAVNTGFGFGGSIGYGISRDVVLSWGVAYHRFDQEFFDGHVSITPITMNVDYGFASSGRIRPWASGGLGLYHVNDTVTLFDPAIGFYEDTITDNDFGFNLGFGISTPITPRTAFGAGFKYHHISGNDLPDTDFLTMQAGLGFSL